MESVYDYSLKDQLNDKKVIIYGWRKDAKNFAVRLLQEGIRFDCFLYMGEDECLLPSLMNKPIIDFNRCRQIANIAIVAPYLQVEEARIVLQENGLLQVLVEIEQIHPMLKQAGEVVIYGTGGRAEGLYQKIKHEVNVQYFADSYKTGVWHGKRIITPLELASLPKDTAVLVASVYSQEIIGALLENGIGCERIYSIEDDLVIGVNDLEWRYSRECLSKISCDIDIRNKGITIYGLKGVASIVKKKMQLLGFQVHRVIERDSIEEDGTIYQLPYEDGVYIITDHYSKTAQDALRQMGLPGNSYVWLEEYDQFWLASRKEEYHCELDPLLGHAYVKDGEEYPGFIKYIWNCADSEKGRLLKIVVLGSSTVSGFGVRQTSWCRYLSDILKENRISHVIYNGGVDLYSATQDLIKLQRDGILLNPDIVISYGGVNNMWGWPPNPAVSQYQLILFESVASKLESDIANLGKTSCVNLGVENRLSAFDFWFLQIKMQKAICDCMKIKYLSFLQPILYSKKISSDKDTDLNIAASAGFLFNKVKGRFTGINTTSKLIENLCKNAEQFREESKKINEDWFHDLSDLFDYKENVYIDNCHLYEKENRILAQVIYEKIRYEITEIGW